MQFPLGESMSAEPHVCAEDARPSKETTPLLPPRPPPAGPWVDPRPKAANTSLPVKSTYYGRVTLWIALLSLLLGVSILGLFYQLRTAQLLECRDGSELKQSHEELDHLRGSLDACDRRYTRIDADLASSRQQYQTCEKARTSLDVDLINARADLDEANESLLQCAAKGEQLELEVRRERALLSRCDQEKQDLKHALESKLVIEFLDLVKLLGTGGDSWICSGNSLTWSFGYASTTPPNPEIAISTWRSAFTSSRMASFRAGTGAIHPGARIVGYEVKSEKPGNGWWRISELQVFGQGEATFGAAAPFMGSANYAVEVFFVTP